MLRSWLAASSFALAFVAAAGACSGKRQASPPPPSTATSTGATATEAPAQEARDPREAALSAVVLQLLEERHLLQRTIDDKVSEAALTELVKRMDSGKMFFLAADVDSLGQHAHTIDDQLRAGRLDAAHEAASRYTARVAVVEPMVAGLLAAPLDLTNAEDVELDDDKLTFATTNDQLRERWRQRLELELLERTAPPLAPVDGGAAAPAPTGTLAAREAKARAAMATAYASRFARLRAYDVRDAAADLINAVGEVLDPHTSYLPPADKANFDIRISGQLEGIGALLRERDHYVEIQELVPGGAAWRQGELVAGDLVLSVATDRGEPVDIADIRIDEVVKMIRGPKGSVVHLKVRRADDSEKVIAITRDVVEIAAAYARGAVLSGKGLPSYGYIYLPSFYGGQDRAAASDVRLLLGQLVAKKVSGVILDLRGNGGGLLDDAVELTGLFIDQGTVVQVRGGDGEVERLDDQWPGTAYDGPVVVLVDHFSASASEIVAAALQDYKRAVVVGTGPTHGKGTVQSLNSLDRATGGKFELGSLKLTIQQFYRANGWSTQLDGVTPDVVLPDPTAYVESGERSLPHAIPTSRVDAAPHTAWPSTWDPAALAQRSAARVTKEPLFAKVAAASKLLLARRGDTRVPLERAAFEARRKTQRDELAAVLPDMDKAPAQLTVTPLEAPPPPPAPGKRADDRLSKWQDQLARDPWLAEAARVLDDARR